MGVQRAKKTQGAASAALLFELPRPGPRLGLTPAAVVYAARCTDPSAMQPIGYVLLLLIAVALAFSASRLGAQR
jgi:hypothetical protein